MPMEYNVANMNGIHHVVANNHNPGEKSLCGRVVYNMDMPITIEHAKACLENGTYLHPCKKCMKKVQ